MSNRFASNRWNWSQEKERWIYIEEIGDRKLYFYRVDPPKEFINLTIKLKIINDKLIATKDPGENESLFKEMMKITKKMQSMRNKKD